MGAGHRCGDEWQEAEAPSEHEVVSLGDVWWVVQRRFQKQNTPMGMHISRLKVSQELPVTVFGTLRVTNNTQPDQFQDEIGP